MLKNQCITYRYTDLLKTSLMENLMKNNFFYGLLVNKVSSGKMPPGKKIQENALPLEKCPPEKFLLGTLPTGKTPPKDCFTSFLLLLTLLLFIFKLLTVTSFRGVSGTPATSIMDPRVTLVNGID